MDSGSFNFHNEESGPQDETDVPNKGGAGREECPTGGQGQVDEHVPRLPGRRPQAPRLPGLRAPKGCKKQFPLCAAGEEKPQPGTVGGAGTLGGSRRSRSCSWGSERHRPGLPTSPTSAPARCPLPLPGAWNHICMASSSTWWPPSDDDRVQRVPGGQGDRWLWEDSRRGAGIPP